MARTVLRFPSSREDQAADSAPDDFGQLVRDVLRHLYDPVYLQTHPLTLLLTQASVSPSARGKRLHHTLLDAIAALRIDAGSAEARASRHHKLLDLRYVDALDIDDVCDQLGISRREYSRQHRRALDAVISLLRESDALSVPSQHASFGTGQGPALVRLPQPLTSFIGREREVAQVRRLLDSARLVTLRGAPGAGKTRLAIRVADELAASSGHDTSWADGIFFVPLAPVLDLQLVVPAIAQTLNVREAPNCPLIAGLVNFLWPRRTLLVLDNFEQVIDAAPVVSHLLATCPHLRLLVTSRESLRLSGEHEFVVPPLAVPKGSGPLPLEQLARIDAVRLYVDRAAAMGSGFRLTEQNAPAVTELCRRLDGLPLAIELAAARSRIFPPYALLARLKAQADRHGSSLDLLGAGTRDVPVRQQTLRNAIDWSYRLLTPDEQLLLAGLSAFAGSWTLEAAEAICADQGGLDVVEGLAVLVDKSLVRQEDMPDGEPRFSMLEMIREYAQEQPGALGEQTRTVQHRHAEYYLAMAQMADANHWGPEQAVSMQRLSRELDNLRAALAWSRDTGEVELALQLGGALMWFWHDSGHWTEACTWLVSTLAVAGPDHRTEGRVAALTALGVCRWRLGDLDAARTEAEEMLAICRELDDRRGMGHALHGLGVLAAEQGDLGRARALIEEGLAFSRAVGDWHFVGLGLHNLAQYAIQENDAETAHARIKESQRVWQELGSTESLSLASVLLGDLASSRGEDAEAAARYREAAELLGEAGPRGWRADALRKLGYVTHRLGDDREARALFTEALSLCRDLDDRRRVAESVVGLACLIAESQPELAARLLGATAATLQTTALRLSPSNQAEYDRSLATARLELGDEALDAAWSEGRSMPLEHAITEALREQAALP